MADDNGAQAPRVKVYKVGNIGSDVPLKFSPAGNAWSQFRLCETRRTKDDDGNVVESQHWYTVKVFGQMAENATITLSKGLRVIVAGGADSETYTDKEGAERVDKIIYADAIGPDLRWATATVEQVKAKAKVASRPAPPIDNEPF